MSVVDKSIAEPFGQPPIADASHQLIGPGDRHPRDLPDRTINSRVDKAAFLGASDLLRALSAPLRAEIVSLLDEHGGLCVHELVEALDAPQPLVSQHLRILRGAGLVTGDRRGREVEYRLADHHIAHIVADAVAHSQEPI